MTDTYYLLACLDCSEEDPPGIGACGEGHPLIMYRPIPPAGYPTRPIDWTRTTEEGKASVFGDIEAQGWMEALERFARRGDEDE